MSELLIGLLEPRQHPLAVKFYKTAGFASVRVSRLDRIVVAKHDTTIVAALKLVPREGNSWFLRAMCVAPDWRRQGVGGELLEGAIAVMESKPCYCFPFEHLEDFYRQGGFQTLDGDSVPPDLQQAHERYQRQGRKLVVMAINL